MTSLCQIKFGKGGTYVDCKGVPLEIGEEGACTGDAGGLTVGSDGNEGMSCPGKRCIKITTKVHLVFGMNRKTPFRGNLHLLQTAVALQWEKWAGSVDCGIRYRFQIRSVLCYFLLQSKQKSDENQANSCGSRGHIRR
jgi:hypothetical protein